MALTLAELSKLEKDSLRGVVMDTLLEESSPMQIIPWETIKSLDTTITRYKTLPSVGFRKVNAAYSESTGTTEQRVESLSILGGDMDCDTVVAKVANTIADARLVQRKMKTKAMAYAFNNKFINGNPETDPEEFKGLAQRIADLVTDGYTGQYIDNGGTAGDGVNLSSAERHNFMDSLNKLLYAIKGHKPDALFMNSDCLLAMTSCFRREDVMDKTKDMFDRLVDTFRGIPCYDIGVAADQTTEIITSTETLEDEAGAESTSIYAVRFGVGEYMWGIQLHDIEVRDLGELDTTPAYRDRVEWPVGMAIADPYSVARLYAIIPNAST